MSYAGVSVEIAKKRTLKIDKCSGKSFISQLHKDLGLNQARGTNKPFFDQSSQSPILKPGGFLGSHPLFQSMEPHTGGTLPFSSSLGSKEKDKSGSRDWRKKEDIQTDEMRWRISENDPHQCLYLWLETRTTCDPIVWPNCMTQLGDPIGWANWVT